MFHPVMPGTYSYTLTPGQLFNVYFHLGFTRCLVWTSGAFIFLFFATAILYFRNVISFDMLLPLIVALFILDTIPLVVIIAQCRRKSLHPDDLPGGKVTLEWDSLSLCVSAGQQAHAAPWGDIAAKSILGGGIMLPFPNGRFAYLPPETPPGVMRTLRTGIGLK